MNHPAELSVYSFLQKAMAGETTITEEVADKMLPKYFKFDKHGESLINKSDSFT